MYGITNYRLFNEEKNLLSDIVSDWDKFLYEVENYGSSSGTLLKKGEDGNYELRLNVAGYKKNEIELTFENGLLLVISENKTYGKRVFETTVPEQCLDYDNIKAKLKDDVLYILFKEAKKTKQKKLKIE